MHYTSIAALGAVAALELAQLASARCSHDIAERGLREHKARMAQMEEHEKNLRMKKRQAQSTNGFIGTWPATAEAEWSVTDPTQECTYASAAVTAGLVSEYPPVWEIANIVPGDTEAISAYNAIISNPNFPHQINPKGTITGNFTGVPYNATDPDCWWSWSHCTTPKVQGLTADISTCPEPDTWGLTYDDGPNCTHNAFYNYLEQQGYKATLFYIGSNVMDWPNQAQRGLAAGHEIGVHTWSHRYSTALTNEQFFAELWYTRKLIKTVLGITPRIWRPPYGDMDDRIRFIAASLNLATVVWEYDTFDWQIASPANPQGLPTASVVSNYNSIIQDEQQGLFATHGTIVLTHELNNGTMSLAQAELPLIAANFKHIMPVSSCLNITQPYDEESWTYATFAQYLSGNNGTTNSTSAGNQASEAYQSGSATSLASGATMLAATATLNFTDPAIASASSSLVAAGVTNGVAPAGGGTESSSKNSNAALASVQLDKVMLSVFSGLAGLALTFIFAI